MKREDTEDSVAATATIVGGASLLASDRITVLGVRPAEASIGPPGLHLRWMFPPPLGFPGKGFEVFRRPSEPSWKVQFTDFDYLPVGQALKPGSSAGGMTFQFHPSARLIRTLSGSLRVLQPGPGLLRVTFREPVVRVAVACSQPTGVVVLRALADGQLVAQTAQLESISDNQRLLRVLGSYVTEIVFQLNFAELVGIGYQTEVQACRAPGWQRVAHLELLNPGSAVERELLLRRRLEEGLRNYYASSRWVAIQRYRQRLPEMIRWQQLLQDPQAEEWAASGEPRPAPDRLKIATSTDSQVDFYQETFPQALLLLAALDPNLARLLSLYWVDAYDGGRQGPKKDAASDYKVVGHWSDRTLCGLLFDLGGRESDSPRMSQTDQPAEAGKLPGVRWQGTDPIYRVGVRWRRPPALGGLASPVDPILFHLAREQVVSEGEDETGPMTPLTTNQPVLVPASSWTTPEAALFVDPAVPLGRHRYHVRGIDLFGQVSEAVKSKPLTLRDNEAPPPPVRLRGELRQPGYPWVTPQQRAAIQQPTRLEFSFEYGAFQHRQAPDTRMFQIFWRYDSLVDRLRAEVLAVEGSDDGPVLRIQPLSPAEQLRFAGGLLSNAPPNVEPGTPTPEARQRRHFRIARIIDDNGLRLVQADGEDPPIAPGDAYWLLTDAHNRDAWEWTGRRVEVRPP